MTGDAQRPIGLLQATCMVAGIIIGASIFVQPSEINRHVPSAAGVLSVWVVAGVLTLFGSLVCAELSGVYPRTGGIYVFLKETLSPACGFLWGWAMFWSAHSGIIAASSMIFARYVGYFVPLGDRGTRMVAIAGILLFSAVNYLGVRQGSGLQTAVTVSKVLVIGLLLVMVVLWAAPVHPPAGNVAEPASPYGEFVLAVAAALFSYGGWHMVTYTAGETRDPGRTIPRALLIGSLTVTACYVALNAAYLRLLPLDKVVGSTRVAADAAHVLAGDRGASLISALVILSATGVLNGVILAGPRTYYAMASEGLAFGWLGVLHPRFGTPHRAMVLQAIWSCALVATGTYRALFTRVIYTEWIFFALMSAGLMRLRGRVSFVPAVFGAAALVVAVIQIAADVPQAASGLLLVAAGLPVYWLRKKMSRETPAGGVEDLSASAGRPRRPVPLWWGVVAAAVLIGVYLIMPSGEPRLIASLGPVTLSRSGELGGISGLDDQERALIAQAMRTGRLPVSAPDGGVPSGADEQPGFHLLDPLARRTLSDRPELRWAPLEGASGYLVKVFTEDGKMVAQANAAGAQWQPNTGLPRGVRLHWQVTAQRGGTRITAPAPPAPKAQFEVVSAEAAERIARVASSPLRLAVACAHEGLRVEAAEAMDAVIQANPDSTLAWRLRDSLVVK